MSPLPPLPRSLLRAANAHRQPEVWHATARARGSVATLHVASLLSGLAVECVGKLARVLG